MIFLNTLIVDNPADDTIHTPTANPLLASLYAGAITALLGALFAFAISTEQPVIYIIAFLLIGIGPIVGYVLASRNTTSIVGSLIGGFIGFIPGISILLWPILVGAFNKTQSIGRLILGSLIGTVLGIAAFLIAGTVAGQDPAWFGTGFTLLCGFWGGSMGAAMAAWAHPRV